MTAWDDHVKAWSRPPVDDVGYIESAEMVKWPDAQLLNMVTVMREARYGGWRNHDGLWRTFMGLDFSGRTVLEYGCGVGMEAVEIAKSGNIVALADISQDNLYLANRIMTLCGEKATRTFQISDEWPFFSCSFSVFDVVNCSGVLHHIRKARLVMERFHEVLKTGGEVRLMVYSDQGWRLATGTEPPPEPVDQAEKFGQFVQWMDGTGDYATWYDRDKIERMFGDLFEIADFAYLTPDNRYCAAVLIKKG